MKDRDTTELTAVPFCLVLLEIWVYTLEERSNEWDLPCWTNNSNLLKLVGAYQDKLTFRQIWQSDLH